MAKIPFLDLRAATDEIRSELQDSIDFVVSSGRYIGGEVVTRFEDSFANYINCNHVIGVGNGLDALKIALLALDIGPGDEALVPSHAFIATYLPFHRLAQNPCQFHRSEEP